MGEEVFIDANIFLEVFLKDAKSEECKKFLKSLQERQQQSATTDFVIYSCLLLVQKNIKSSEAIKNAIMFFNNYHNFRILRPFFDEFYNAIEIMETNKLDFDDSLVVACMKNYGIKEIASLDKHFDNVKGIKRIEF